MKRKTWRTIGFAALGLLIFLVVSVALQLDFPKPTGPLAVGRTSRDWIDASRAETLSEQPGDFRAVPVTIWYPATGDGRAKAPYFPDLDRLARSLAASGEVAPLEVLGLRWIKAYELPDAPLAEEAAAYPVVILSPGNGTNVEFYAALAGELASQGYIVVGINHPYDVAAVVLPDGTVARFAPGPFEFQEREAWVSGRVAERTADILFALEQLETLDLPADPLFAGRVDLAHVAVMGHSLGGIAAAEACRAGAQFLACLNLDGIQRGGPFSTREDPVPPDQPFMLITKEPQLPPKTVALFKAIPSGSYRVVIHGASHASFTDGPLLAPSLLPLPNKADQILSETRKYTLAFFDQTLKGRPSPILVQSLQSEQVSLEIYPPHS